MLRFNYLIVFLLFLCYKSSFVNSESASNESFITSESTPEETSFVTSKAATNEPSSISGSTINESFVSSNSTSNEPSSVSFGSTTENASSVSFGSTSENASSSISSGSTHDRLSSVDISKSTSLEPSYFVSSESASDDLPYSTLDADEMLEYDDKIALYYLLGAFCFMIVSNIIWALVRFCLVVPHNKKILHLEQHYKLVENEYRSEKILMSSKEEMPKSDTSKSDRSILVTSSEVSKSDWSDVPSSLKSQKAKIKKQPLVVAKTQISSKRIQLVQKPKQGPILISDNSKYEEIGNVNLDDIYSTPMPSDKSIKSAKLFSEEEVGPVPFSMLSDGGRGIPLKTPPFVKAPGEKKAPTKQSTEESTEEEKGTDKTGKTTTTSSSSESEKETEEDKIYKL